MSISTSAGRSSMASDGVSFHDGLTLAFYCLLFAHCNIVNVEIWILHDDGEAAVGKP